MFNRRAHKASPISVHVGVGQRCRAVDVESPAIPFSLVLVHVGVGQRSRARDVEPPAILPTMSTRNVPAGRWMKVQGMFKRRADTPVA